MAHLRAEDADVDRAGRARCLGDRERVAPLVARAPALLAAADHDLKPLKRSGLTHEQHLDEAADVIAAFLGGLSSSEHQTLAAALS